MYLAQIMLRSICPRWASVFIRCFNVHVHSSERFGSGYPSSYRSLASHVGTLVLAWEKNFNFQNRLLLGFGFAPVLFFFNVLLKISITF